MMKEQVRGLLAQPDNVTMRVLPTKAALHSGLDGPFSIIRFAEIPAKAYVEDPASGNHIEGVQDVTRPVKAFATLAEKALSPADSRQLLSEYVSRWIMRGPAGATWRRSSYSGSRGDNCVEVGMRPGAVSVRDTKRRDAGILTVSAAVWAAFIGGIKDTSR